MTSERVFAQDHSSTTDFFKREPRRSLSQYTLEYGSGRFDEVR
ncbi:hypothetical protein ADIS_1018 [Lunatimonas lonarensis]|uniref:Uncharacterized protein n=1 Tax=Lunatimonas lonarensis TaxID=1232681 RepID=R7ZWV6_9BACT|nr:hypothetical protein ADIS_1018 [Lunatimonas lonarensis]